MFKNFLIENKRILSGSILLLFILSFLILFSSYGIYTRGKDLVMYNEDKLLSNYSVTLKNYFLDISNDLNFIASYPATLNFVNSSLSSVSARQDLVTLLSEFMMLNKRYERITFLDNNGKEKLKLIFLKNKNKVEKDDQLKILNENLVEYYWQQINENELFVSMTKINPVPETSQKIKIDIVSGLYNSNNEKTGFLITEINLDRLSQLLSDGMFIQTEEGDLILSNYREEFDAVEKSGYIFNGSSGILDVGESSELHYTKVEFLPGKFITIASFHDHGPLINNLIILIITSSAIIIIIMILLMSWLFTNYKNFKDLMNANKAMIFSLAQLAEFRDGQTGAHLTRTRKYTAILALEFIHNKKYKKIINNRFLEELDIASIMHDIGKVGIKDSILLKKTSLTPEEYEEIKKHVLIGSNLIDSTIKEYKNSQSIFAVGKNIIKYHHEKFDGSGYPHGLKGEEIPLEARIFALADAYDVIRSRRPYKEPLPHTVAIERILSDSNRHFDPEVVEAFMNCEKQFLEISLNS